jgi:hypothetical protein
LNSAILEAANELRLLEALFPLGNPEYLKAFEPLARGGLILALSC